MKMKNEYKGMPMTKLLLLIYLIILTWIILFKMALSIEELPNLRNVNLIPFGDSAFINGRIDRGEIISNVVAFIPVGVYISMIRPGSSFMQKLGPVIGLSLSYEILQFIFGLGATDITDLIGNTAGGATGILMYLILMKRFHGRRVLAKVINSLGAICTGLLIALIVILIGSN